MERPRRARAHATTAAGAVTGTSFAVWAPNARGVRVVGDFNYWDGRAHPMRSLGPSGVWELFVPGVGDGTRYKFEVLGADGVWREKADPMAQRHRGAAGDRVGGVTSRRTSGATRTGCAARAATDAARQRR